MDQNTNFPYQPHQPVHYVHPQPPPPPSQPGVPITQAPPGIHQNSGNDLSFSGQQNVSSPVTVASPGQQPKGMQGPSLTSNVHQSGSLPNIGNTGAAQYPQINQSKPKSSGAFTLSPSYTPQTPLCIYILALLSPFTALLIVTGPSPTLLLHVGLAIVWSILSAVLAFIGIAGLYLAFIIVGYFVM